MVGPTDDGLERTVYLIINRLEQRYDTGRGLDTKLCSRTLSRLGQATGQVPAKGIEERRGLATCSTARHRAAPRLILHLWRR